jgi:hypothetical protein
MIAQTARELYPAVNRLNELCSFVVWSTGRAGPEDPPAEKLREAVIELRQVVADLVELVEEGAA